MSRGMPGYGDEATWGACYGHPNDPRTDNEYDPEERQIDMALDELRDWARIIGQYKAAGNPIAQEEIDSGVKYVIEDFKITDKDTIYFLETTFFHKFMKGL